MTSPVSANIWTLLFEETAQSGLNLQGRICRMMFSALVQGHLRSGMAVPSSRELAEQMNETSASIPHGEDEFLRAGLTAVAGRKVKASLVAESPVNFECRLSQCIQLTAADGTAIDTWLVLGEVVAVHIDESLLKDGIYQTALAKPVLRAGGPSAYYMIDESHRFDMIRPDAR